VAGGQAPPGSTVTVVPWGEWPFAVFVTGLDGVIYTTAGGYQQGFPGGWAAIPIPNTEALPGSPVTVIQYGDWPFEVFVTGLDGVIYTTVGNPQTGFPGWATVAEGRAPPGSPVTVSPWGVPWGEFPFAVFVTGLDGVIYGTAGGFQQGFPGGWGSVPGITAPPGSPVTVSGALVQPPPDQPRDLQLFVTGLDGVIYTTIGNPQTGFPGGWTPAVPGITAPPGSPVTGGASEPIPLLYVTDVNGGVYTTLGSAPNWSSVGQPQGTAAPGSPVNDGGVALFVTSPQGEVLFTRANWP
jgi:hypothetical protein